MNKSNLIKVNKIIKKYKNINFKSDDDLFKKGIVDSFDILNIINDLENEFKVKIDLAKEKKFVFSAKKLSQKITNKK
jgi:acyl carrier protein